MFHEDKLNSITDEHKYEIYFNTTRTHNFSQQYTNMNYQSLDHTNSLYSYLSAQLYFK